MYAVIQSGGKQYRVSPGDVLDVELIAAAEGAGSAIQFDRVLMVSGDGGLQIFMDALEGPGAWKRLPATPRQLLRDNATTLIGQMRDQRPPFSKADAEAITTQSGMWKPFAERSPLATSARTITPIVFWASFAPCVNATQVPETSWP